ncbi:MAG TPA: sugar O-acetyltransferase [Modicisalibacter sp.]|nr:sugar O-acetyltransferase [Modicisalibacter sp.]
MPSEKEKMLAGERYNPADPELVAEHLRARELCMELNSLPPRASNARRQELLAHLFKTPTDAYVTPPFFCDYGSNIELGSKVYFNFNCVVLDGAKVTIGSNVLFGPAVQVYTALHPMDAEERRSGIEFGEPIFIGDDVWLGGGTIICPGVSIGVGSIIGAGSVVTRDIPSGVFAAGNPCRVIRPV